MTELIIAIAGFFAFTIWARFVSEKGMKLLSSDQKAALIDRFSKTRKWSVLILAAIILTFLAISYKFAIDRKVALYAYFGAFLLYTVVVQGITLVKISKLDFPKEFVRTSWMAGILRLAGLIILIVCMTLFLTNNESNFSVAL